MLNVIKQFLPDLKVPFLVALERSILQIPSSGVIGADGADCQLTLEVALLGPQAY